MGSSIVPTHDVSTRHLCVMAKMNVGTNPMSNHVHVLVRKSLNVEMVNVLKEPGFATE